MKRTLLAAVLGLTVSLASAQNMSVATAKLLMDRAGSKQDPLVQLAVDTVLSTVRMMQVERHGRACIPNTIKGAVAYELVRIGLASPGAKDEYEFLVVVYGTADYMFPCSDAKPQKQSGNVL